MNTCRFCKKDDGLTLIKYGARHYAHARCFLLARAGPNGAATSTGHQARVDQIARVLDTLSVHQINRIPVVATFDRDERAALTMAGVGMTGREFMDYARGRA